jgi:hypothetical protein
VDRCRDRARRSRHPRRCQEERISDIVELGRDQKLRPEIAAIDTGSANIDTFDEATRSFRTSGKPYVNVHDTLILFCRRLQISA